MAAAPQVQKARVHLPRVHPPVQWAWLQPLLLPPYAELAQAVLVVVLGLVFCSQILPSLLFNRTRGRWAAKLVWPIRLLLWLMTPITVFIRFFFSVASLSEKPVSAEEETADDVEALFEACRVVPALDQFTMFNLMEGV